jgi:large subunit ribosomal protein L13
MERETHKIDAKNQVLGRLVVRVSTLLRGKHRPDFAPYKDTGDFVVIKNIKDIKVTGKKMDNKKYYRHSGYLGGLKEEKMRDIFEKDPSEVFKKAVYGMMPHNKLKKEQIKRLKFE